LNLAGRQCGTGVDRPVAASEAISWRRKPRGRHPRNSPPIGLRPTTGSAIAMPYRTARARPYRRSTDGRWPPSPRLSSRHVTVRPPFSAAFAQKLGCSVQSAGFWQTVRAAVARDSRVSSSHPTSYPTHICQKQSGKVIERDDCLIAFETIHQVLVGNGLRRLAASLLFPFLVSPPCQNSMGITGHPRSQSEPECNKCVSSNRDLHRTRTCYTYIYDIKDERCATDRDDSKGA
jgi:hypothetical protein